MRAFQRFFPLFIQIPETEETILHYVLKRQYRKKLQTFFTSEELKSPKLLPHKEAAIGGFSYNFSSKLPNANYAFGTFLRHPIAQVNAQFQFLKTNKTGHHAAFSTFTLADFVAHPFGSNYQTRIYSGIKDITGCDDEVLEIAKTNLAQFFFTGITEEFDAGLLTLQKKMGWRKKPYYLKGAFKEDLKPISDEEKKLILKNNALDVALYEFGKTLWLQQKNAAEIDERQVQKFALRNHWYAMLAAKWLKITQQVAE